MLSAYFLVLVSLFNVDESPSTSHGGRNVQEVVHFCLSMSLKLLVNLRMAWRTPKHVVRLNEIEFTSSCLQTYTNFTY